MSFAEVGKRNTQGVKHGFPAVFTLTRAGVMSLRLNRGAMEYLKEMGQEWAVGDMIRIFHDLLHQVRTRTKIIRIDNLAVFKQIHRFLPLYCAKQHNTI